MDRREQERNERYARTVEKMTPNSRHLQGCLRAFWVGGVICAIGQAFTNLAVQLGLSETTAPMFTTCVLVFLGSTLTGLGVYDRIGRYAGAGSIVPITGFANSVTAPAMEFRREGLVLGLGARLFQIAGPVLTYGISTSVLVGVLYWMAKEWVL